MIKKNFVKKLKNEKLNYISVCFVDPLGQIRGKLINKDKVLKSNHPLLFFIQRIRDEAHRFAITAHRYRRKKQAINSLFNNIQGIGPKKKNKLLSHFRSIKSIKQASLEELSEVKGITKDLAERIYGFFHSQ